MLRAWINFIRENEAFKRTLISVIFAVAVVCVTSFSARGLVLARATPYVMDQPILRVVQSYCIDLQRGGDCLLTLIGRWKENNHFERCSCHFRLCYQLLASDVRLVQNSDYICFLL